MTIITIRNIFRVLRLKGTQLAYATYAQCSHCSQGSPVMLNRCENKKFNWMPKADKIYLEKSAICLTLLCP